ncbi:TFIID-domain-containing protein [Dacryopinax primogenitus]|uniref:Transcription initiation factor TFIID subunit 13 n=1 Tax=Dacryopinax primogenitus (strain DJM 731) TaxID=1858805 RepID=M5G5P7_DACPD|nr:TFIID-domain-containing protein [Dacryopinax primogenitus]EJU05586.1 TFIID-domain-containing protein [Dacryopinax primogenitus]
MPTPTPSAVHSRAGTPAATATAGMVPERQPARARRGQADHRERGQVFKNTFTKDLMHLMYAFGDVPNPAPDTVGVMEEIVIEYILDLCQAALRHTPSKNRLHVDDLRWALRHEADAKELGRLEELLFLHEEIKRARAEFEVENGA